MMKNHRQALIEKIGVPVTQGETMAGGIKTAYLSAGDGYPVVCLHGGGAGAVSWYQSIAPLAKSFHVIAPDVVGYGESDKPDASYDRPYFSAWLKSLLSALGVSKAHIVGSSQGGAIALQFVLDYPAMVDRLVLVDSGALGAKSPLMPLLAMLCMNLFPSALTSRFYTRYLLFNPKNKDADHGRYSIEVLKKEGGKNAFFQGKGSAVSAMPEELLRTIKNQTLLIWGENDKIFPIENGVRAATIMPNATLCRIKEAGHVPLVDQPQVFNKAVLDFLTA